MNAISKLLPDPVHRDKVRRTRNDSPELDTFTPGSALAVSRSGAPVYGARKGWIPRSQEDYGDGGSFPEIHVAQYPLEMGLDHKKKSGGALTLQVDGQGKIRYDAIATQGRDAKSSANLHTSFKDLVPLRNRVDTGEIDLSKPSEEEIQATAERTNAALQMVVSGQLAASRPKTIKTQSKGEPTYVRYTPANQMGEASDVSKRQRIVKMFEQKEDPLEPPKHRHRKVPRGPGSPPPPIMHSPPRKVTAKDQQNWAIPPSISNWKNSKGYTVPLEARLAADGRGLKDNTIHDNFAKLTEALAAAERLAREEVRERAMMQQKLADKERQQKEDHLRELARRARESRNMREESRSRSVSPVAPRLRSRSISESPPRRSVRKASRSRNRSVSSRSDSESDDEDAKERERLRRERRADAERAMRIGRMGREGQMKHLERENNRDISEKIALGLAKPTANKEAMYDQRLFNQTGGLDSGFGAEDDYNLYDKPLFANRDTANAIYRPFRGQPDDGGETMNSITNEDRFDVLGQAGQGFKGSDTTIARDGPVEYEKDDAQDKFGISEVLEQAKAAHPGNLKHAAADVDNTETSGSKRKKSRITSTSKWD